MLVGPTRAMFLAAISAVSLGAVIAACSAATAPSSGAPPSDAEPPCPARFGDVATATCTLEGQSCTFLSPCLTFATNATCTCTGGSFTCTGFGDAGTSCPILTTAETCPASERAASGLFCSALGLVCTYPSACQGIPAYDSCQCIGGLTAGDQPHFECNAPCTPTADAAAPRADGSALDGSPLDGTILAANASSDAPDAAPSIDGANDANDH
jgi:hypothetical protein